MKISEHGWGTIWFSVSDFERRGLQGRHGMLILGTDRSGIPEHDRLALYVFRDVGEVKLRITQVVGPKWANVSRKRIKTRRSFSWKNFEAMLFKDAKFVDFGDDEIPDEALEEFIALGELLRGALFEEQGKRRIPGRPSYLRAVA